MTEPLATADLLDTDSKRCERLPISGLLALATAGFITILTEALPAGLLPQMSLDLKVSQALVGQLVTFYALGSLLAAIPLVLLTQGWPNTSRCWKDNLAKAFEVLSQSSNCSP